MNTDLIQRAFNNLLTFLFMKSLPHWTFHQTNRNKIE